jgi:hypothetical protein
LLDVLERRVLEIAAVAVELAERADLMIERAFRTCCEPMDVTRLERDNASTQRAEKSH